MAFNKSSYLSLNNLQTVCLKQNIPFASYRLPLDVEIITLVQHHSLPEKLDSLLNVDNEVGFVVSPFNETSEHGTYFLKPDCVCFSNEIEDTYIQKLSENNRFLSLEKLSEKEIQTTASEEYINNVNAAKMAMTEGKFHKVVLSKVRLENLPEDFKPEAFFLKLCSTYPHAFVYLIQLPGVGCWMGATPEPLLVIENEQVKTVSLAGTQIATNQPIESYQWSSKEIEEQGIVTNFVEQTLKSLDIKHCSKVGPTNYQAANLIHLKTAFEFPQAELKNRLGDFLKALHPTPSVGGLPKAEAREFILANEKHDRSYYTGFLGPVNIENKTNIFVNLRCLQLFDKQFVLYSGAGITTSSVAENEWTETDNKMLTMMNVMMTPKSPKGDLI
ncbi:MAG: isochorismate synthase [Paludibacter sp.]|nr:isochorismate synthase [Paludibacter sp.]